MSRVIIYYAPGNARSEIIGKAMYQGLKKVGEDCLLASSHSYRGPRSDIAVFYGLAEGLRRVLLDYRDAGRKAFYIDLGYWSRRKRSRWDGYHKIVLNGRHPTAYFQNLAHPSDRFAKHHVKIEPWRGDGGHIIVAGMSAKAAAAEHLGAEEWERKIIARLKKLTSRQIIYRPKPNWAGARNIPGATIQRDVPLEGALRGCHAVVTHHSNVGIDAILAGVPVFCVEGAAMPMANPISALCMIDRPLRPAGREQWAADLAYCQFSVDEMADGTAWKLLAREGLTG